MLFAFTGFLSKAVKFPIIEAETLFKVKHKLGCFFVILTACYADIKCLLIKIAVSCFFNIFCKLRCISGIAATRTEPKAEI